MRNTKAAPLRSRAVDLVYLTGFALTVLAFLDPVQLEHAIASVLNGADAFNYWSAWQGGLYHGSRLMYGDGVYLYSPVFAQLLYPFTLLPFGAFRLGWAALSLTAFVWLIAPAPLRWKVPLAFVATVCVAAGGIEWLLCLVVVLRYPALWAVGILTKVTPGIVLVGNPRALVIALGATGIVAGVSFVIAPHLWLDWFDLLARNLTQPHYEGLVGFLPVRLAVAAGLVLTSRSPIAPALALIVATPDINVTTAGLLCAIPRLAGALPARGSSLSAQPRTVPAWARRARHTGVPSQDRA